ncbi:putative alpha/beta hydrolase fold protein [Tanacetum coccineum]|uniref:Alpha/beta hydrolase fold protein n=1 Tax=Tanacetum coccineum TaxID=301880 RepID=A0ABQ5F530_9ASTR
MAAEVKKKISAASARSHTRRSKPTSSSSSSGVFIKFLVVFFFGFLAYFYQAGCPPAPKKVGPPDGLPITTPRIKLRDGRHLSYKEYGVPKESAKYKIIFVHGYDSVKHYNVIASTTSPALIEELGIYIVSFDRPGYGESDPDPKRTLKSFALDTEELADQLGLGSKFFVVGFSMGGQAVWSFLKYIPHRLAGATLIAPVVNYWWPNFPSTLSSQEYSKQFVHDKWSLWVAHHLPSLTYWWNTRTWLPPHSVIAHNPDVLSPQDRKLVPIFTAGRAGVEEQVRQQGEFESIHRDLNIGFGAWEFDPMDIENPFPNNEGSVHMWQGDEDILVPATLQRYIAQQLPWINYHELKDAGHMFPYADGMSDSILKALLLGKN